MQNDYLIEKKPMNALILFSLPMIIAYSQYRTGKWKEVGKILK